MSEKERERYSERASKGSERNIKRTRKRHPTGNEEVESMNDRMGICIAVYGCRNITYREHSIRKKTRRKM